MMGGNRALIVLLLIVMPFFGIFNTAKVLALPVAINFDDITTTCTGTFVYNQYQTYGVIFRPPNDYPMFGQAYGVQTVNASAINFGATGCNTPSFPRSSPNALDPQQGSCEFCTGGIQMNFTKPVSDITVYVGYNGASSSDVNITMRAYTGPTAHKTPVNIILHPAYPANIVTANKLEVTSNAADMVSAVVFIDNGTGYENNFSFGLAVDDLSFTPAMSAPVFAAPLIFLTSLATLASLIVLTRRLLGYRK